MECVFPTSKTKAAWNAAAESCSTGRSSPRLDWDSLLTLYCLFCEVFCAALEVWSFTLEFSKFKYPCALPSSTGMHLGYKLNHSSQTPDSQSFRCWILLSLCNKDNNLKHSRETLWEQNCFQRETFTKKNTTAIPKSRGEFWLVWGWFSTPSAHCMERGKHCFHQENQIINSHHR